MIERLRKNSSLLIVVVLILTWSQTFAFGFQEFQKNHIQQLLEDVEQRIKLDPIAAKSAMDSLKMFIDYSSPNSYAGEASLLEGMILLRNNDDNGLKLIEEALTIFEEVKYDEGIANSRLAFMDYYKSQAIYGEAMKAAFAAVEIQEKWEDQSHVASTFSQMADIFWYMERFEEGTTFGDRAVEILSKLGASKELAFAHQMVGDNHLALLNYDDALVSANTTVEIFTELGDHLAELASAINARANIYKYTDKIDAAISDYQVSLSISDSLKYERGIRAALSNLGHIYYLQNEFAEAIPYKLRGLEIQLNSNNNQQLPENLKHLGECYAGIGNLELSHKYMMMLDSVRTEEYQQSLENELNDLMLKYETEKKEESIKNLNQQVKSQRTSLVLGGGLLLFTLLGLFIFKKLNSQLKVKNKENVILLKEIHHRVKNNLQILSSLLSLQADHLVDSSAIDAIQEGRNRVESMGLIHQRLYGDSGLSNVDMADYGNELCRHLEESFSSDKKRIKIVDNFQYGGMDVDFAIPLGLIINELVTNSMKYAFENRVEGTLHVSLLEKNERLVLNVTDDGNGKPSSEALKKSTSFGSKLITALNKKLKGKMFIDQTEGYSCTIEFLRYKKEDFG